METATTNEQLRNETEAHESLLSADALAAVDRVRELEDKRSAMQLRLAEEENGAIRTVEDKKAAETALEAAEREEILDPSPDHAAAVAAAQGRLADVQDERRKHLRAAEVLGNEIDRFESEIQQARSDARDLVMGELNMRADVAVQTVHLALKDIAPRVVDAIAAIRVVGALENGPGQLSFLARDLVESLESVLKSYGGAPPPPDADPAPELSAARALAAFLGSNPGRIPHAWVACNEDLARRVAARQDDERARRAAQREATKSEPWSRGNEIPTSARTDIPAAGRPMGGWIER